MDKKIVLAVAVLVIAVGAVWLFLQQPEEDLSQQEVEYTDYYSFKAVWAARGINIEQDSLMLMHDSGELDVVELQAINEALDLFKAETDSSEMKSLADVYIRILDYLIDLDGFNMLEGEINDFVDAMDEATPSEDFCSMASKIREDVALSEEINSKAVSVTSAIENFIAGNLETAAKVNMAQEKESVKNSPPDTEENNQLLERASEFEEYC